jgi:hypothetical protein
MTQKTAWKSSSFFYKIVSENMDEHGQSLVYQKIFYPLLVGWLFSTWEKNLKDFFMD